MHTFDTPPIVPVYGVAATVTTCVAPMFPQVLAILHDMVAVPVATPVTIPVDDPTEAMAELLLVQTPPLADAVSVIVVPVHKGAIPEILNVDGSTSMVTTVTAVVIPQELVQA